VRKIEQSLKKASESRKVSIIGQRPYYDANFRRSVLSAPSIQAFTKSPSWNLLPPQRREKKIPNFGKGVFIY
jgi:hypothetical protein